MTLLSDARAAWRLLRVCFRLQRLIRKQRQLPRDDREPFIVYCDARGRLHVVVFDEIEKFYVAREDARDFEGWAACYDPWKDRR